MFEKINLEVKIYDLIRFNHLKGIGVSNFVVCTDNC